jgi:glucose/arabinose dehydrogenase
LGLELVAGGFDEPIGIASAGDGSGHLFVVERTGYIRLVQEGVVQPTPFLDISDRVNSSRSEQGLLGLAFHPDYVNNTRFFVNYINVRGDTVLARFEADAALGSASSVADAGSEVELAVVDQPAANHNGGQMAFGPDGYLYVAFGDGGGAGDPYENAQNVSTLLGSLIRVDVDQMAFAAPSTNPFVGVPGARPQIWSIGLRNPWRFSFDRLTGDLFIADVGQSKYEEINFQMAGSAGGQNYGWPFMEGLHCFPEEQTCDQTNLTLPIAEYDHSEGCSVTGGYVYRGQEFPLLQGVYLFGDYCSGTIWGLGPAEGGGWQTAKLLETSLQISSFGQDDSGELYVLDSRGGDLFRIVAPER